MEKLIEKLALYDILARLVTGIIVVFAADFFGIVDLLGISVNLSELGTATLLVAGYFCGVVLETIAMLLPSRRKKYEEEILKSNGCCVEQYEEWKKQLPKDNKQIVMDEPMAHIVMSLSLAIAFSVFFVVKVVSLHCPGKQVPDTSCSACHGILILAFLVWLFCYRAKSYTKRRVEQIFEYCKDEIQTDSGDGKS